LLVSKIMSRYNTIFYNVVQSHTPDMYCGKANQEMSQTQPQLASHLNFL